MSDDTREVEVDRRGAYLTFDALERTACWAVDDVEWEVEPTLADFAGGTA